MDWLDTLLNFSTFVVIGVLVWPYLEPEPADGSQARSGDAPEARP